MYGSHPDDNAVRTTTSILTTCTMLSERHHLTQAEPRSLQPSDSCLRLLHSFGKAGYAFNSEIEMTSIVHGRITVFDQNVSSELGQNTCTAVCFPHFFILL